MLNHCESTDTVDGEFCSRRPFVAIPFVAISFTEISEHGGLAKPTRATEAASRKGDPGDIAFSKVVLTRR
jgi:hypothetical protein